MQPVQTYTSDEAELSSAYQRVRGYTERLCEPLNTEDFIPQPIVDVSPARWNIAHTTWFFEQMILRDHFPDYKEFHPRYHYLFNSYYNAFGDRTPRHKRGDLSRPTVAEIFEYRKHVDKAMVQLFEMGVDDKVKQLTVLGINHEQQHQELFVTDLKYTFSLNPLFPVYREDFALVEKTTESRGGFEKVEGGIYKIGFNGEGFCFDNELARHKVCLEYFEISKDLVTNGDYCEFIEDGGYSESSHWHSEGWDWVNENKVDSPLYWTQNDGNWHQYTLAGLREVRPDDPVCHISFYEASAFATWKGMRLPTEFEWETASDLFDWGLRWEWTNSAYLPYPGFKTAAGAVGEYNGKFMVNQMILRGGSVATPEGHSRKTYRNFFHPNLRWQFTGIRLAR
ncbi:MAG: ergothioneine biosynthesis protein EgtB [Acidobacteria bacterium]|mgnify:CR=1 FL=1|nr:MAG: ergothioneine biosynthesis protein EgtB [Acidobacteriota bacterium]REK02213.1 MAG: ergothioneine biosynthesis protein EgtB [Acidobacteriota bacterium]REK13984.1 MAG: ergothioneine biosynthesis protein EgtB [Acidobacteriota bacterium]REK41979.1 MAG: ergothioneine biosynthesis protein EgtB [Acidobacteriota bacterium]